jgi:hypothetical protein
MCLIITSQNGSKPIMEDILSGWKSNPHSWGIMTTRGRSIKTSKGFDTASLIREVDLLGGSPWAIHFRYATHGRVDAINAHPFKLRKNLYMMHNGIINIDTSSDETKSDTWHYAQYLKDYGITSDNIDLLGVGEEVGPGNKVVFMDSHGTISIANEKSGLWVDDQWYSNSYSLAVSDVPKWWTMGSWDRCDLCNERGDMTETKDGEYLCSDCMDEQLEEIKGELSYDELVFAHHRGN